MTNTQTLEGALERLDDLSKLSDGWFWGEGVAPVPSAVEAAREVLQEMLDYDAENRPVPGVFPTPDGGVQLEWSCPTFALDLEIRPDGTRRVWFCGADLTVDR